MIEGLVLIPLAGAGLTFLTRGRGTVVAGLLVAGAAAGWALRLTRRVSAEGVLHRMPGGWGAPLGIELRLDGFGLVMVIMLAAVGAVLSVYAAFYGSRLEGERRHAFSHFWPLWLFLWAALNGVFVSGDLFTLYLLVEVGLLAAVAMAALSGSDLATEASLRYLLAGMVGSLAYLMGVAILYNLHGTLDLLRLAEQMERGLPASAAVLLMTLGLLVKTAVFPLHFWLPPAHAAAPAPVSAILSGLVVKGSFFVLLRIWIELGDAAVSMAGGQLLGLAGAAAIGWGSIQAMRQKRMKMLIAYSTVAQVGVMCLLFPVLAGGVEGRGEWFLEASSGGVIYAAAHAMAKSALFLGSGIVILARGTDELARTRGLARSLPITFLALGLAGIALVGPPLSGGYEGKTLMQGAADGVGQWWWSPVFQVAGVLTAGYVLAMLRFSVLREAEGASRDRPPRAVVPVWVQAVPLVLALGALILAWPEGKLADAVRIGGDP